MKNIFKLSILALATCLLTIPNSSKVEAEQTEINTSVTGLKFVSGNLGFELSVSDYNGANKGRNFDSIQRNTNYINAFEKVKFYSASSIDFQKNNPGGGSTYSSFGTDLFPNMWAPQTWLEQNNEGSWIATRLFAAGDIVYIPAGTSFPSFQYLEDQSTGLKKYVTTEDVSFIYTPSKTFVQCEWEFTSVEDLLYVDNGESTSYLSFKVKNSDYSEAPTNKSLTTSKIDHFSFRKNISITGEGCLLTDTLLGAEHNYHYSFIINKDGSNTLSVEASGVSTGDLISIPQYSTFPLYSYLSGASSTPKALVVQYHTLFRKDQTKFTKTTSEPFIYENDLPVVGKIEGISAYTSSSNVNYSYDQAVSNSVPTGFTKSVSKGTGNNVGFTLGYSLLDEKINFAQIISMKIRCYVESTAGDNDSYPEIRITFDAATSFVTRLPRTKFANMTDNWIELDLNPSTNTTYCTAANFAKLKDESGYLRTFEFGVRSNNSRTVYLDCVELLLKESDKEGPVITYNGPSTITTKVGRAFSVNATAFDMYDAKEVTITYEWYNGSTKLSAIPTTEGTYSLHLVAQDASGNSSFIALTVIFEAADLVAPVINLKMSTIHASVGEKILFNVTATDDVDGDVPVSVSYPSNMFDVNMYLRAGTFVCTFTASDLSNNIANKQLTLVVA